MPIEFHHYHHFVGDAPGVGSVLAEILKLENRIVATQKELAAQIAAVTDRLTKIGGETSALLKKVDDLSEAVKNGPPVSPEVQTAMDALTAQAQVVDDLVPDAPPPPPAA